MLARENQDEHPAFPREQCPHQGRFCYVSQNVLELAL